jgi:hypothetical protein
MAWLIGVPLEFADRCRIGILEGADALEICLPRLRRLFKVLGEHGEQLLIKVERQLLRRLSV